MAGIGALKPPLHDKAADLEEDICIIPQQINVINIYTYLV
jgi:hypothetical protein